MNDIPIDKSKISANCVFICKYNRAFSYSDIFYDIDNDLFYENRYDDSSIDYGDYHFYGTFKFDEKELWIRLVHNADEESIEKFLSFKDAISFNEEKEVTSDEFDKEIKKIVEQSSLDVEVVREDNCVFSIKISDSEYKFRIYKEKYFFKASLAGGFSTYEAALASILSTIKNKVEFFEKKQSSN